MITTNIFELEIFNAILLDLETFNTILYKFLAIKSNYIVQNPVHARGLPHVCDAVATNDDKGDK